MITYDIACKIVNVHVTQHLINVLYHRHLRADVCKYRPEVYKSEESKILKNMHKVTLDKLLT